MNNAKMWLVVSPTVGVPLFLGAVAVGSFAVHLAVLSKTSWFNDFAAGKPLGTTASLVVPSMEPAQAAYLPAGAQEVTIMMPDGTTQRAILELPGQVAALN